MQMHAVQSRLVASDIHRVNTVAESAANTLGTQQPHGTDLRLLEGADSDAPILNRGCGAVAVEVDCASAASCLSIQACRRAPATCSFAEPIDATKVAELLEIR